MKRSHALCAAALALLSFPLAARDSLGVYSDWGAFRDANIPRCYAIAKPFEPARKADNASFASIGTWPLKKIRSQVHFRLSQTIAKGSAVTLQVGSRRFTLTAGASDAWAKDPAMDAAIVAAMRSARTMRVYGRDRSGKRFSDRYRLQGAASAMDAATLACVPKRKP